MEDLDIANYEDDTRIYTVKKRISALETSSSQLLGWFNNNFLKANSDKSDLLMSCTEETSAMIYVLPNDSNKTKVSKTKVFLGISL